MNKAITDGLVFNPPSFAQGLNLWSREDGRPGQPSYANQSNASIVSADQDFGVALELQKNTATQKVRAFYQTPIMPGLYLKITVRLKAISGAFPAARIATWVGRGNGTQVPGVVQAGPSTQLNRYGDIVELTAIVGSGRRGGVTMVWGATAAFFHVGLDLTGPNSGIVRIADIEIEDITGAYLRDIFDSVDVRDYGAIGDGITDDTAAFDAADAAARGRTIVVPAGVYYIADNLAIENPIRFQGTLLQPSASRTALMRNYDLDTYTSAFGNELTGFKKALQALFYFTDHVAFDMSSRRVDLVEPLDVALISGLSVFSQRRYIVNGQLNAINSSNWSTTSVTANANYNPSQPTTLTGVSNVLAIPVGSRVIGTGVGREVYVNDRDIAAGTLTISQPLWGGEGSRSLTFERYKYMLDFSGFSSMNGFELGQIEIQCNGIASGIMLPKVGISLRIGDCLFNRPKDRAITSIGLGCQGLIVDSCQFISNERALSVQNRTTIALNLNANDAKIRDNRVVRFAHFIVMNGDGHLVLGNHFFQGDNQRSGVRTAGIVITRRHARLTISGNYIDNCWLEWSNEHDAFPDYTYGDSFGGFVVVGNHFFSSDSAAWFRFFFLSPKGRGHFLSGASISDNTFRCINTDVDRVDGINTSFGSFDYNRFKNVTFAANSFSGLSQATMSPLVLEHSQNTAATTWTLNPGPFMPFGSYAQATSSIATNGPVVNGGSQPQFVMPYVQNEQGTNKNQVTLHWPVAVSGKVFATIRCDNPN